MVMDDGDREIDSTTLDDDIKECISMIKMNMVKSSVLEFVVMLLYIG